MPQTDHSKPKCQACGTRNAGPYPGDLCRHCYDIKRGAEVPEDLAEKVKSASSASDWKELAEQLAPTFNSISLGLVKATAAQVRLIQHVYDRAYGKVSKAQEEKAGPLGIVVLPSMGAGDHAHICPKCIEAHKLHV